MNALEAYADRLSRKSPDEREVLRQRNEAIEASPVAPGWLHLAAGLTLAALTALDVGGDPALALREAVAASEADVEALEDALLNVAAFERFVGLADLFTSDYLDGLAGLLEALPESTIATLQADLAWLVGDLTAHPDIRALAASLAAVLELARAGEVDEELINEACVAATEVAEIERARRPSQEP